MKKNALIVLSLLLCAAARPALCANSAGTGTAAFLKLPADARSAGMGDAAAGAASGAMAVFQNPAGLAGSGKAAVAFSHALLMEGISYDVASAAVPLGKAGVLGVGAQYLQYGVFDSVDNTGAAAGSLSPKDSAFTLGWGVALDEDIMVGAAVKYIDSEISGSAATAAMDLGLLINGEDLSVGLAAQNMGKGLKYNKEASPLPVNVKLGVSIPHGSWAWAVDLNFPKDGSAWLAAGAEYSFALKDAWTLSGRAGYNSAAADTDGVNGVSAGFGLARKKLSFDYAFRTMGVLGSTHHLGLSFRWGK